MVRIPPNDATQARRADRVRVGTGTPNRRCLQSPGWARAGPRSTDAMETPPRLGTLRKLSTMSSCNGSTPDYLNVPTLPEMPRPTKAPNRPDRRCPPVRPIRYSAKLSLAYYGTRSSIRFSMRFEVNLLHVSRKFPVWPSKGPFRPMQRIGSIGFGLVWVPYLGLIDQ